LSIPFEVKAFDTETGVLEGYAGDWAIDNGNDIIERGSYKKSISERVPKGLVKLLDSHMRNSGSVLGTVIEVREENKGLWFKAKLSAAPGCQDTIIKIKEGHLDKLSIGYRATVWKWETDKNNNSIRRISELTLYEISVLPFAMNENSKITSVKSANYEDTMANLAAITEEVKAGRRNSKDDALRIIDAIIGLWDCLDYEDQEHLLDHLTEVEEEDASLGQTQEEAKNLFNRQKALEQKARALNMQLSFA